MLGFWLGRFTGPLTGGQVSADRTAQAKARGWGDSQRSSSALLEHRGEEGEAQGGPCITEGLLPCSQELDFSPNARGSERKV